MSRNKMPATMAMGATAVLGLALLASAASADLSAATADTRSYKEIQSISYDLGSKSTSGYFVQQDGQCQVVLMVSEKTDPDAATAGSPARLRLSLKPGQAAGLDSAEGQSLSFACGEQAGSLTVTSGTTAALAQAAL
jgi:hypothetical protein